MICEQRGRSPGLVPELVLHAAHRCGGRTAIASAPGDFSYDRLLALSGVIAAELAAARIAPGMLVGIGLPRGAERLATILATWRIGAVALMLDPEWPERRLAQIVSESGCTLVTVAEGVATPEADNTTWLHIGAETAGDAPAPVDAPIAPDDLAYIIYTSGSTGRPKGVEITHGNLAALVAWHVEVFDVTEEDRASHLAGLGFDAAIWEVWPYLAHGASVRIAPEAVRTCGPALRDWLIAGRTTIAFAPTLLAEQLIRLTWPQASLRTLLAGGDRLRAAPPAGLPFALVNNYGPSECTVVATSGVVAPGSAEPPAIGRPIAGGFVHILDAAGRPVGSGAVGEICVGGAIVGRGYRGDPAATAAAFVSDPFAAEPGGRLYRTGDLGRWREDGTIEFRGRKDDQLKIRGYRIEPDEVAATLLQHPDVQAAAVAAFDRDGEPALAAYVVPAGEEPPAAETLLAYLAERLPEWSLPSAFVRMAALPTTANGKLDRAALPIPAAANALPARAHAAPASPTEERLLAILAQVLGDREIGVDDNFFLLGGHSLLGTQVVLRASAAFGVDLTLRHLFHAPTVRELAATIEQLVDQAIAAMDDEELLRAYG